MNLYKLAGPDTSLGRLLMTVRAETQILGMRLGGSDATTADVVRLARLLVPRYTMVSVRRLKKLFELGAELGRSGIEGSVVECGVWNGGSSAMVARGLASAGDTDRRFWLFDSFEGMPEPTKADEAKVRANFFSGWCKGEVSCVREAHRLAGHSLESVTIVPGWFDDTLARHVEAVGPIAMLHVDADWYASVRVVLDILYPRVVPGGTVIIDDYGRWRGCRDAVHDYFGDAQIAAFDLRPIDNAAVSFRKP